MDTGLFFFFSLFFCGGGGGVEEIVEKCLTWLLFVQDPDDTGIYGTPDLYINPNDFTTKVGFVSLLTLRFHLPSELMQHPHH